MYMIRVLIQINKINKKIVNRDVRLSSNLLSLPLRFFFFIRLDRSNHFSVQLAKKHTFSLTLSRYLFMYKKNYKIYVCMCISLV